MSRLPGLAGDSAGRRNPGLTYLHCSLHPTQYPWEHAKWNKTFDSQA